MVNLKTYFASALLIIVQLCSVSARADDPTAWLAAERQVAATRMMANISRPGTAPGSVIAAPSTNPNYYYHWVRDASLAMDMVVSLYEMAPQASMKQRLMQTLQEFVDFSRQNQITPALGGIGEPKFNLDGTAFDGEWGRPQDDGPALRAIALAHLARVLLTEGQVQYVRTRLYDGQFPSQSVIKTDLEYIANHWREPCYDLWEEVDAEHFYTRMVQRRAMLEGAGLARTLGDNGAADWYRSQAVQIQNDLARFWRADLGYFVPSLNLANPLPGSPGQRKTSGLDSAVILAVLHGYDGDSFLPPTDDHVMSTMRRLIDTFAQMFAVNKRGLPGVAIGRYPEDIYGGTNFDGGNPWVLITLGFGEMFYRISYGLRAAGGVTVSSLNLPLIQAVTELDHAPIPLRAGETLTTRDSRFAAIVKAFFDEGDQFMLRIKVHANPDGSLWEQINRDTGQMSSAPDLTWSYVALLSAAFARDMALRLRLR